MNRKQELLDDKFIAIEEIRSIENELETLRLNLEAINSELTNFVDKE